MRLREIVMSKRNRRERVTRVRALCPACGEVSLTTLDVELEVWPREGLGRYHFRCPDCTDRVSYDASSDVIDVLVAGGVQVTTWDVPEEARELRSGPPITWDDVLDFRTTLESADWFDRLKT